MQTGFVALLDVLGFSSLISSGQGVDSLQRYLGHIEEALTDQAVRAETDYVVFSDSIVLTTRQDSEDAFKAIVLGCSRVLALLLAHEIPLRGAVAHGSFLRSPNAAGIFVAGKAIIDAYQLEVAQDWVGIMIAPSVVKRISNLAERCSLNSSPNMNEWLKEAYEHLSWAPFLQPCAHIPFHASEGLYDGFAIVPMTGETQPPMLRNNLIKTMENLKWLKSLAPNPSAQSKYDRSLQWLYQIQEKWRIVAILEQEMKDEKKT